MIIDRLENSALYYGLGGRLPQALKALAEGSLNDLPVGRHNIDGDNIFALVQEFESNPRETGKWEAHRRYADIQFIASGTEMMGCASLGDLTVTEAYDAERDVVFLEGDGNFIVFPAGTFVIFYPNDAHMPSLAPSVPAPVRKIVLKVLLEN